MDDVGMKLIVGERENGAYPSNTMGMAASYVWTVGWIGIL